MPLHPQAQQFLDELAAQDRPDWNELPPDKSREVFRGLTDLFGETPPVRGVEDVLLDDRIPARVYSPLMPETTTPDGGHARGHRAVLYFHGGGWVIGDLETHDGLCRRLANASQSHVIAVDYRRSPEVKYPGPLEDCYQATKFVAENGGRWNIDAARIAVAGDSAGGNLAAAVCLLARDRGGPSLALQVLIYPALQYRFDTASYEQCAEGFGLTREVMRWFWQQYLRQESDGDLPYVSPLLAENLVGLPPAHVITAEYDVLRDDGERYAERLQAAGVAAKLKRYDGMLHAFTHFVGVFHTGSESIRDLGHAIRTAMP